MPEVVNGKRVPPDAWCAKGNYGTRPGMRQLATCGPNVAERDSPEWTGERARYPHRLFLQKSVDLIEDKGLDFLRTAESS
jgi:hypothetical protein